MTTYRSRSTAGPRLGLPAAAAAVLLCLAMASPASAFIRATVTTTDASPIFWDLDETVTSLPSVVNGEVVFTIDVAGSDNIPGLEDMDAVARAFKHWEGIGSSRVAFARGADQAIQVANQDNINAVYWAEGAKTTIGGNQQNVTGFVSMTPVFKVTTGAAKGTILDANIILNGRQFNWTVTPDTAPADYDVESVVTHEIGHLIGLDHSPVLGSAMSPRYVEGEARQRTLELDDILGASTIYPDGNFAVAPGGISGAVGRPAGVFGALVCVQDASGRVIQESITSSSGAYAAPGLPDGDYDVYVEPVDPLPPSSTNLFDETDLGGVYGATIDPNFFATLPLLTTVTSPAVTTRSFLVGSTAPLNNIAKIGQRAPNAAGVVWKTAPTFAVAGDTNIAIGVAGPNIGAADVFEITGPGITDDGVIDTGSVDGEPYVIHQIDIAANAPVGLRSIRVTSGSLGRTYATGALKIYPNLAMSLGSPGLFSAPPGEVNNGRVAGQNPVTLAVRGNDLDIDWDDEPGAYGYNVYRGNLTTLAGAGVYSHQMIPGDINGQCALTSSYTVLKGELLDPAPTYYLVAAWNNAGEGIIGRDSSNGVEPPASPACPAP